VQKAAWFYQLIRFSYASSLDSFGSQPHDMRANFPLIEQAHRRLAKVVVENKDFEKLIRQYDRPVSFFLCDPPINATESYYTKNSENQVSPKKTMFDSGLVSRHTGQVPAPL
jgi:DNA adenine methylase